MTAIGIGTTLPAGSDWESVRHWRVTQRQALTARRMALSTDLRRRATDTVLAAIEQSLPSIAGATLGLYWPFRGELDVRGLADDRRHIDSAFALPVVVEQSAPLEFRSWWPGMKLARGVWDIPIPAVREVVRPDVLVVPLLGYDDAGFRLGYGGGYYDRTLAALRPRPFTIGVGYACGWMNSIVPQAHDIPMDVIITEQGVRSIRTKRSDHA